VTVLRVLGAPTSEAEGRRRAGPELWLVRHGETAWAREGRHTGRSDVPLSAEGERQARDLGARLGARRFAAALTSPLARARETARLAGFDGAIVVPELAEWDYGALEGRLRAQVLAELPGWTIWRGPVPGGESLAEVEARADRALARAAAAAPQGDAVLFAHGYILRAIAARWLGQPAALGARLALEPGAIAVLGWEYGERCLRAWNVG
jgi:probable phosphoglycerate mutase